MIIGIKRSGEALSEGGAPGEMWTAEGVEKTTAVLSDLSEYMRDPDSDISGAIVVVGAGNGGLRGDTMVKGGMDTDLADQQGMTGTIMNARVVARGLRKAGTPHQLFLAPEIDYRLPGMERITTATPQALAACLLRKELAIVGGGSGIYGQTTDAAIIDYLAEHRDYTDQEVVALKGTKVQGVYDSDPDRNPKARLLSSVSAGVMRARRLTAVDARCLDLVEKTGISIRVHHLATPLVLAAAGRVGTDVVAAPDVMEYASR